MRLLSTASPHRIRLLVIPALLGSYALRLLFLARQDIWWDEARNIDVALRPFLQIPTAPELDIHPPIYFWLLHVWGRLMGIGVERSPEIVAYVARYLSVAAGVVGVALLYRLTRFVGTRRAALIALVVGAISPFWLAEAQEARMYTVGFALLSGAAVALLSVLSDQGSGIRDRPLTSFRPSRVPLGRVLRSSQLAFILLSALAFLTHYNVVFVLVAWYAWWGIVAFIGPRRWRRLGTVILSGLATALLVAPIAPIALRQIPSYENPNLTVPTVGTYLWQNWWGFLAGYAWHDGILAGLGDAWLWAVLAVAVWGIFLWAVLQVAWGRGQGAGGPLRIYASAHPRLSPPHRLVASSFFLAWLLGGLALYYVAVLDRGAFNIRYSSFVTPALYVLLGIALAVWEEWRRWLPVVGVALLLAGMVPAVRADLTDPRFFREDTAGLATWLRTSTGAGDVIFVDQKYPFGFYYERYAIDPDEAPAGPEAAPARYLFVDINTVDERMDEWAGDAERVFWVQWFESDTDPRGAVSFLLDKYGERAGEQTFQGYRVNWWDLAPPTDFDLRGDLQPLSLRWRHGLATVEASLPEAAAPGDLLPVVIRWQRAGEPLDRPLKARVALYDAEGARLAQDDRRLLNDRHLRPGEWAADDRPLNVYSLPLPPDLPPGLYTVRVLVYDEETLDPIELIDEAGNAAGIEAVIGKVGTGDQGSGFQPPDP